MDSPNVSRHIPELDGLRGAAIALGIYFHYVVRTGLSLHSPLGWFNRTLGQTFSCGVDLVFVLSSFLIDGIIFDRTLGYGPSA